MICVWILTTRVKWNICISSFRIRIISRLLPPFAKPALCARISSSACGEAGNYFGLRRIIPRVPSSRSCVSFLCAFAWKFLCAPCPPPALRATPASGGYCCPSGKTDNLKVKTENRLTSSGPPPALRATPASVGYGGPACGSSRKIQKKISRRDAE